MANENATARPKHRQCPGCGIEVPAQQFVSGSGIRTWLWRCACGWCSAISESGVLSRSALEGFAVAKV